jgi:thioredoxin reductase (NADPH)
MNSDSTREGGTPVHQAEDGANDEDPSVRANPRYYQLYPTLTDSEIDRMRRFGSLRRFRAGDVLYRAGGFSPGMFVLLAGKVRVVGRDGLGHERLIRAQMQRGEFSS